MRMVNGIQSVVGERQRFNIKILIGINFYVQKFFDRKTGEPRTQNPFHISNGTQFVVEHYMLEYDKSAPSIEHTSTV